MPFQFRRTCAIAIASLCAAVASAPMAQAANVLIENVTVIDGTGRPPMERASVLIKDDRIFAVSPVAMPHESGVQVINGAGKYLIPGLIDTHIHLAGGNMKDGKPAFDHHMAVMALHSYLWSGVTTLFDAGHEPDFIFPIRDEERSGKIISPRLFATGNVITVPGGYGAGGHAFLVGTDWDAIRPTLDAYFKQRKPDMQKTLADRHGVFVPLNPSLSAEQFHNVVKLANENGIRVTVHAASEEDYNDALDGGMDNFAHVVRFPSSDALLRRVSTKRVVMTTTLSVHDYIVKLVNDPAFLTDPFFKATMPEEMIHEHKTVDRANFMRPNGNGTQSPFFLPIVAANIKKIYQMGGTLAAGTDRTWGPTLHMELDLLNKNGIPMIDVIKMATLNAAMYLGKENEFGSIERGKLADIVLLNADPLKDVKNFQAIEAVYKGGQLIDRGKLDVPANEKAGTKKK